MMDDTCPLPLFGAPPTATVERADMATHSTVLVGEDANKGKRCLSIEIWRWVESEGWVVTMMAYGASEIQIFAKFFTFIDL